MTGFTIWECMVCGWIYDESKGWPEDDIEPGTRWADVPDDWTCPECGVSKEDFEMVKVAAVESPKATPTPTAIPTPAPIPTAFQIWECMVCGWIYDEAKGAPDDGLAPGTRWVDIAEDWICPECGVGKDDFDMVAISAAAAPVSAPVPTSAQVQSETDLTPTTNQDDKRPAIVIIGTGLAGYNLARAIRKTDTQTPLILCTSDDGSFYSKPLLSTSFHKQKAPADIPNASASTMATKLNADIHIFTQVLSIDSTAQTLTLRSGNKTWPLAYGKLVLATGASAIEVPVEGSASGCVYTINDLQDFARFHAASVNKRRVTLIGAGLIGSEYANDLIQSGFALDVIDPLDRPLATLLPEAVGKAIQGALATAGVKFHFGTTVKSLDQCDGHVQVALNNGDSFATDIVVSAIGVRANTQLAQAAGLKVARGIVTDRLCQTSAANIYALGDCAEVDGHLLYYIAPLVAASNALARTLTGTPQPVHYGVMPVVIKTTLCPTVVSPPAKDQAGEWQVQTLGEGNVEALFYDADQQLKGYALCGERIKRAAELDNQLPTIMQN